MDVKRSQSKKAAHNRLYYKNKETLQKVILKLISLHRGRLTAKQITKAARLSRQTLYHHYPCIEKAPLIIEREILALFKSELHKQSTVLTKIIPDQNQRLFYSFALFMAQRREVFCPVCANKDNHSIIYKMMETLYPDLLITWLPVNAPRPEVGSEKANMFLTMCVEIICRWGSRTHCDIHKSRRYINRLLALASEAYLRCK